MKVLILGGTGMLGHKLLQTLSTRFETWATIRGDFNDVAFTGLFDNDKTLQRVDVKEYSGLEQKILTVNPDVVVNAVGVIKQAPEYRDVSELITINSILPHKLAEMSARHGFRLVLISTDCVFSGKRGNYSESDTPDAEDVYGISKHLGEISAENCVTLRTSLIGRELTSSNSLVEWFLNQTSDPVRGFTKAIYSGFPTVVFSDIVADLIVNQPELSGVFHLSSNPISKYDFLSLVNEEFGIGRDMLADEEVVIDRSLDSSRYQDITGFRPLPWQEMIRTMAADPTPYNTLRQQGQPNDRSAKSVS